MESHSLPNHLTYCLRLAMGHFSVGSRQAIKTYSITEIVIASLRDP